MKRDETIRGLTTELLDYVESQGSDWAVKNNIKTDLIKILYAMDKSELVETERAIHIMFDMIALQTGIEEFEYFKYKDVSSDGIGDNIEFFIKVELEHKKLFRSLKIHLCEKLEEKDIYIPVILYDSDTETEGETVIKYKPR